MKVYPELPESLWENPLFTSSAFFNMPNPWFTASRLDYRIRQLRNMPSCSDDSVETALAGVEHVMSLGRKWIDESQAATAPMCREHLRRAEQLLRRIDSNAISCNLASRMGEHIISEIAAFTQIQRRPEAEEQACDLQSRLKTAISCLMDYAMLSDSSLKPRYLKRLYRTLDSALEYNATSDEYRNRNVFLWLRQILETGNKRQLSYVDVGCSIKTGARNTILASEFLRPDNLCREIHGTDIVTPPEILVKWMFHKHRIHLYQADPVRHPLSRNYDAILLANVHRHLDSNRQHQLLRNLCASLTEDGLLVINWHFDAANSPCLYLQRHGNTVIQRASVNAALFTNRTGQQSAPKISCGITCN